MNKLIVTTAFFLLGTLANSAMAAKPLPEVALTAGPVYSYESCNVANHTDQTIEVFLNICRALKDNSAPAECFDASPSGTGDPAPIAGTIAPGYFEVTLFFKFDPLYSYSCELTYLGHVGDITGVLCGSTVSGSTACLPLQPH